MLKPATNRVLVIGLRNEQSRMLRQLYQNLSIDFLGDQDRHCRGLNHIEAYNKIVVVTKFTSHKTHNICKKHSGYQMVSGGFSSVKNVLGAMA